MLQVGVNAAVAEQTHEMQGGIVFPAGVHGADIGRIFKKAPIVNGFADAGQILKHHPACADIGVAHLAVAHLPLGQAHVQAGGRQTAAGALGEDAVQVGLGRVSHGVARTLGGDAKAIHDNQSSRCFHKVLNTS